MNEKLTFYARREGAWGSGYEIIAGIKGDPHKPTVLAKPTELHVLTDQEEAIGWAPWINLGRDSAQNLMDELWSVGLRPSEGSGSAGSLAATERHLADMRALVFRVPIETKTSHGPDGGK